MVANGGVQIPQIPLGLVELNGVEWGEKTLAPVVNHGTNTQVLFCDS